MLRRIGILCCAFLPLLGLPGGAAAAQQWAAEAETCGGHNNVERGSGQLDAAGRLYVPCSRSRTAAGTFVHDNYVAVMDAAGRMTGKVPLDFDRDGRTHRASDVAPSPDGSFLYVIRYTEYTVYRFDRQADGSYVARSQQEWSLRPFPAAGGGGPAYLARGQFLATDAAGDLYLSAGLWTCQDGSPHCTDNAIVKYRPDGAYVTRFGRKVAWSWTMGDAHGSFGGVAVTADGRRVFATDINNSRVQRFDRAADGSYGAVLAMGMNQHNDPNRWGACFADGVLGAPYDVTLTARGELMVINTSCFADGNNYPNMPYGTIEVQRYGQDGTVRGSIRTRSLLYTRVHGIAIDRSGNLHLLQAGIVARPAAGWSDAGADAGGGGPLGGEARVDLAAPRLVSVAAPATTVERTVSLVVDATDDTAVTELRLRVDGVHQPWRAFATRVELVLADRLGDHVVAVQVRDQAGNVSEERAVTIRRDAPPAPVAQPVAVQPAADPAAAQPGAGEPAVQPNGAAASSTPVITAFEMPVQLVRGRIVRVVVRARSDERAAHVAATHVRFSVGTGRWSTWRALGSAHRVALPAGSGWKGVLVQVRDADGGRSQPWFRPVFMAPRGSAWRTGTAEADRIRLGAGDQHVDLSHFDGTVDRVSCGSGFDTVLAQPEDIVARSCERVQRFRSPRW